MDAREIKKQVVYPVIVALTVGGLAIFGEIYVTQKLILQALEELTEDVGMLYSLTNDHVKEGH